MKAILTKMTSDGEAKITIEVAVSNPIPQWARDLFQIFTDEEIKLLAERVEPYLKEGWVLKK